MCAGKCERIAILSQYWDTKILISVTNRFLRILCYFLVTAVGEEDVFDMISFNIQRGRDHQLPAYSDIREKLGLPRADSYGDITNDAEIVDRLTAAYGLESRP